jgi:hypothetical protein
VRVLSRAQVTPPHRKSIVMQKYCKSAHRIRTLGLQVTTVSRYRHGLGCRQFDSLATPCTEAASGSFEPQQPRLLTQERTLSRAEAPPGGRCAGWRAPHALPCVPAGDLFGVNFHGHVIPRVALIDPHRRLRHSHLPPTKLASQMRRTDVSSCASGIWVLALPRRFPHSSDGMEFASKPITI